MIIGATSIAQLESNLSAIEFSIAPELRARLDNVSEPEPGNPYMFYGKFLQARIHGGMDVRPWAPARVTGGQETITEKSKATSAD